MPKCHNTHVLRAQNRKNRLRKGLEEILSPINMKSYKDKAIWLDPSVYDSGDEESYGMQGPEPTVETVIKVLRDRDCPEDLLIDFEDRGAGIGIIPIMKALKKKNYSKNLQLYLGEYSEDEDEISLESAEAIAAMLKSKYCPKTLVIDLQHIPFSEESVQVITEALLDNNSVIELNLTSGSDAQRALIEEYCLRNFCKQYPQLELIIKALQFNGPEVDPTEIDISNTSENTLKKQILWIKRLLNAEDQPKWLENTGKKKLEILMERLTKKLELYPVLLRSLSEILHDKNLELVKKALLCQTKMFGLAECLDIICQDADGLLDDSVTLKLQTLSEEINISFETNIPEPKITEEEVHAIKKLIESLHQVVSSLGGEFQKTRQRWKLKGILDEDKINKFNLALIKFSKTHKENYQPRLFMELHKAQHKNPSESFYYAESLLPVVFK